MKCVLALISVIVLVLVVAGDGYPALKKQAVKTLRQEPIVAPQHEEPLFRSVSTSLAAAYCSFNFEEGSQAFIDCLKNTAGGGPQITQA